ncbi:XRE family transcriptional regulator [Kibdelosporangium persicum]|uniref:XRE family transcriptional regulator n=1 Tax=Kibdelosporangium persicum TaxID=2698649 RepID=A0ABX2FCV1_9PSEU|nr:XRE family transcriptional regulator [Kibdelosporangium persicum]NRN69188.1 XRE family transcriptional regulator [Kibdelosporangium persicum]
MSQRKYAATLKVGASTVAEWARRGPGITLQTVTQDVLNRLLEAASSEQRDEFATRLTKTEQTDPSNFPMSALDTAEIIHKSTADDMAARREVLVGLAALSGAALVSPVRRWAAAMPMTPRSQLGTGRENLDEIEKAVSYFRRWDSAGSGGLHRKAVIGQLNATAESLMDRASVVDQDMRRRQFHVAAELLQLTAWMSYDDGLHQQAQKYQMLGLHAAHHADAPELGAKIVGDMTQLSTALGNYDDSLCIVRTALSALPRQANPLVRSELYGLEARALAHLGSGESSHARRAAEACVEVFHTATPDHRPDWLHYMTAAEVRCLAANTYIQLALQETSRGHASRYASEAEQYTLASIETRESGYSRSAMLDSIRLSKVRIAQDEPDEAVRIASNALASMGPMTSAVVTKWLVDLHQVLMSRCASASQVQQFHNELADYLARVAPEKQDELLADSAR